MTEHEQVVYRQLAIPVSVFDRIKDIQRRKEAQQGARPTLMGALAAIVREHQEQEERGVREHDEEQHGTAALLRR